MSQIFLSPSFVPSPILHSPLCFQATHTHTHTHTHKFKLRVHICMSMWYLTFWVWIISLNIAIFHSVHSLCKML
jgi:hypothetical protein